MFARSVCLLATLAALAGCASGPKELAPLKEFLAIDLRSYTAAGFLFTPDPLYAGKYESLGLVSLTVAPSGRQVPYKNSSQMHWEWAPIKLDEALREAQARVVEMGGNALVNFKIEPKTGLNERPHYTISGFAIKRLDVGR